MALTNKGRGIPMKRKSSHRRQLLKLWTSITSAEPRGRYNHTATSTVVHTPTIQNRRLPWTQDKTLKATTRRQVTVKREAVNPVPGRRETRGTSSSTTKRH
ncbi:hypothetical protein Bca4012_025551 [Brassica carinata]